jgi:hypothetical protein
VLVAISGSPLCEAAEVCRVIYRQPTVLVMTSAARIALVLPAIPLTCGLLATAVYPLQGGFGGGHGSFDGVIVLLGLPCSLLVPGLPAFGHDLVDLIWVPTVMNMVLFESIGLSIAGPLVVSGWLRNGRRSSRQNSAG